MIGRTRALHVVLVLVAVGAVASCGSSDVTPVPPTPSDSPTSPYLQPQSVYLLLLVDCLKAKGYDATLQEDGGVSLPGFRTGKEQEKLMEEQRSCTSSIDPRRLEPPPELTDDQWMQFYGYLVAQVECLRSLGHDVPPPPDFETWRASDRLWDPYIVLTLRGTPAPHYNVLTCQHVPERPAFIDW